jgi:hypothetical protein
MGCSFLRLGSSSRFAQREWKKQELSTGLEKACDVSLRRVAAAKVSSDKDQQFFASSAASLATLAVKAFFCRGLDKLPPR